MVGGQQSQILKQSGDQGSGWQLANITLSSLKDFSITIEVVHTTGSFLGDIAIDDIAFVDCTPGAENSPASCDFEGGLCSLQHVTSNVDFNWERNKGGTGSYDTGPKTDHTTNSAEGYYIFTEASYPRRQVGCPNSASVYYSSISLYNVYCVYVFAPSILIMFE